jgi:hypothetical protein
MSFLQTDANCSNDKPGCGVGMHSAMAGDVINTANAERKISFFMTVALSTGTRAGRGTPAIYNRIAFAQRKQSEKNGNRAQ